MSNTIWTIGHSTRSIIEFKSIISNFGIEIVADVRSFPGSRKFPQFNKEVMEQWLKESGFGYVHYKNLGGRRKMKTDSNNKGWRLAAFRGYADYMETQEYKTALKELEKLAKDNKVAYMCSEAVWWSCHRSLISDDLKNKGWEVIHIMNAGTSMEHPYTKPAKIIEGKLTYPEELI
ncbi:MAG: DUF488 domain-containing protein [Ferruginibacter sp.]